MIKQPLCTALCTPDLPKVLLHHNPNQISFANLCQLLPPASPASEGGGKGVMTLNAIQGNCVRAVAWLLPLPLREAVGLHRENN
jgi:hypothetical protein